jgi:hypothetical protein
MPVDDGERTRDVRYRLRASNIGNYREHGIALCASTELQGCPGAACVSGRRIIVIATDDYRRLWLRQIISPAVWNRLPRQRAALHFQLLAGAPEDVSVLSGDEPFAEDDIRAGWHRKSKA